MSHVFNPQPIPRMRLIQEAGPMPTYIGAKTTGGVVRDEFVEATAAAARPQAVLMPAKPVPSVAKGPKGKRAAGVSPARATVTKKRKSAETSRLAVVATTPMAANSTPVAAAAAAAMQLPPLPPGGVRPPNCKYRNSYPLPQQPQAQQPQPTQTRRRRTVEDFLTFCKMILDYENYTEQEDRKRHSSSPLGSTGSSTGSGWEPVPPPPPPPPPPPTQSATEGKSSSRFKKSNNNKANGNEQTTPSSPGLMSSPEHATEDDDDDEGPAMDEDEGEDEEAEDGWNSVTCFCKKPFAGRPMIECSQCLTWVHLKCAKLQRKKIPDEWFCQTCRRDDVVASPPPPTPHTPSSQASSSKAKGQKANSSNGANKAKSSPTKPIAGARKRKSSLTSKRVVVITDTSSPVQPASAAGAGDDPRVTASPSSSGRRTPQPPSEAGTTPVTSPTSCGDTAAPLLGRGEWLPRQEVGDG